MARIKAVVPRRGAVYFSRGPCSEFLQWCGLRLFLTRGHSIGLNGMADVRSGRSLRVPAGCTALASPSRDGGLKSLQIQAREHRFVLGSEPRLYDLRSASTNSHRWLHALHSCQARAPRAARLGRPWRISVRCMVVVWRVPQVEEPVHGGYDAFARPRVQLHFPCRVRAPTASTEHI